MAEKTCAGTASGSEQRLAAAVEEAQTCHKEGLAKIEPSIMGVGTKEQQERHHSERHVEAQQTFGQRETDFKNKAHQRQQAAAGGTVQLTAHQ